jgi:sensor histidine kinase YesM
MRLFNVAVLFHHPGVAADVRRDYANAEELAAQCARALRNLSVNVGNKAAIARLGAVAHLRALIGQDTTRANAMIDHLNDYLRTTLQATRLPIHQPLHPLADEFSRLHDYLSLMAIRMGPRMVFELDLPSALAQATVPRFILQPLVENAIRHGLEPQVSGGHIEVQARAEGQLLLLTVRDNGCGISDLALAEMGRSLESAIKHPGQSWGLSHVRQRLHTLYAGRASMDISPVPTGGTCVVLTLPLDKTTA